MKIIDMKCPSCGANMERIKGTENLTVEKNGLDSISFYSGNSLDPEEIKCPFCGHSATLWKQGEQTQALVIIGNVTNSKIVIGNDNVL